MRVIIAGGRDFNDYNKMVESCDEILGNNKDISIVSGMANGADRLGERYAKERGHVTMYFPAQWNLYGKSAGHKRNVQMAENADMLIAFWDGKSKGTEHMIKTAKKLNLIVNVISY